MLISGGLSYILKCWHYSSDLLLIRFNDLLLLNTQFLYRNSTEKEKKRTKLSSMKWKLMSHLRFSIIASVILKNANDM